MQHDQRFGTQTALVLSPDVGTSRTTLRAAPATRLAAQPAPTQLVFRSKEMQMVTNTEQDQKSESIALHLGAIIAGLLMMFLGVGLSVTMVLLPIGIPLGLVGLGVFIWGLVPGWRR
jgi:hypothetical protein